MSWAPKVESDLPKPSPLIGVEISIVEPDETRPVSSLIYEPAVCHLTPPESEMPPVSSPQLPHTQAYCAPSVVKAESPPGSGASSTDFLPSPASSQGLFD